IQSQDGEGNPLSVVHDTQVQLSRNSGTGNFGGTLTGTITVGTSEVMVSGISYDTDETGVSLQASRTAGDNLTPGTSAPFTVLATEPVNQVVSLNATAASETSVDLTWTRNASPGENVII